MDAHEKHDTFHKLDFIHAHPNFIFFYRELTKIGHFELRLVIPCNFDTTSFSFYCILFVCHCVWII